MIINKEISEKLVSCPQHRLTLKEWVSYCEDALLLNTFQHDHTHKNRNILAQTGTADVKNFGLNRQDFEGNIHKSGYTLQVMARHEN